MACWACRPFGVQMQTVSKSRPEFNNAVRSPKRGGEFGASVGQFNWSSGRMSQIAASRENACASISEACLRPIWPRPTTAKEMVVIDDPIIAAYLTGQK